MTSKHLNVALLLSFAGFVITAGAQTNSNTQPPAESGNRPVKIIKKYAPRARGCRPEGSGALRVRVTFDKSSVVTNAEALGTSGCDYFDQAALAAARKIKFEPATRNGEPITTMRQIEYRYHFY